jgi:hypothetical protein
MIDKNIHQIDDLLADVSRLAELPPDELHFSRASVSGWSVAQQLDHILKVCSAMLKGMLRPGDAPPGGINMTGRLILLVGRIPRGRGKAPERLRGVDASPEELAASLAETRRLLAEVRAESFGPANNPIVRHPYFGGLTPSQTLRTIVVHTRHHLRIAREIIAAR